MPATSRSTSAGPLMPGMTMSTITTSTSLPSDNQLAAALPEIWSYGHRVPHGLFFDAVDGTVWEAEPGERGGDEPLDDAAHGPAVRLRAGGDIPHQLGVQAAGLSGRMPTRRGSRTGSGRD